MQIMLVVWSIGKHLYFKLSQGRFYHFKGYVFSSYFVGFKRGLPVLPFKTNLLIFHKINTLKMTSKSKNLCGINVWGQTLLACQKWKTKKNINKFVLKDRTGKPLFEVGLKILTLQCEKSNKINIINSKSYKK